jgi:hypothetical protein
MIIIISTVNSIFAEFSLNRVCYRVLTTYFISIWSQLCVRRNYSSVFHVEDPCKPFFFSKLNYVRAAVQHQEKTLHIKSNDEKAMLCVRTVVDEGQLDNWRFDTSGAKTLKGSKLTAGLSLFLLRDERRLGSVRARLRLERSSLNSSLVQREITADPTCPQCKAANETTDHCLMECKQYENERKICFAELQRIGVQPEVSRLLGNVEKLPAARQGKVLESEPVLFKSFLAYYLMQQLEIVNTTK